MTHRIVRAVAILLLTVAAGARADLRISQAAIQKATLDAGGATLTVTDPAASAVSRTARVSLRVTDSPDVLPVSAWSYKVSYRLGTSATAPTQELEVYRTADPDRQVLEARMVYPSLSPGSLTISTTGTPVVTGSPLPSGLELRVELAAIPAFDPAVAPVLSYASASRSMTWPSVGAADEYDLEWVFVSTLEYAVTVSSAFFKKDAVRVTMPATDSLLAQTYPIDPVQASGTLYFRVRGVGRHVVDGVVTDLRRPGIWSAVQTVTVGSTEITAFESSRNWTYEVGYSEGGKRKRSLAYFDGAFRERQKQTALSSENVVVVQDVRYDQEGRQAVTMLPAPVPSATATDARVDLEFLPNFTLEGVSETGTSPSPAQYFDWRNFGRIGTVFSAHPASTSSGAGRYFSSNNNVAGPHRDYIPDAGGYPYSITIFTNDDTGRPRESAGPGAPFRLGIPSVEPRTSKFIYGSPDPSRVLQLFGADSGQVRNYQKDTVIDPNGQPRVAYKDLSGRTVATALSRDTAKVPRLEPAVSSFPPNAPGYIASSVDLLAGTSVAIHPLSVSELTDYDFEYKLDGVDHGAICNANTQCASCTYSLEIWITDPEGGRNTLRDLSLASGGGASCSFSSDQGTLSCTFANPSTCAATADGTAKFDLPSVKFKTTFQSPGTYVVRKMLRSTGGSVNELITEAVANVSPQSCTPPSEMGTCISNCEELCLQYPEGSRDQCRNSCANLGNNLVDAAAGQQCSALLGELKRDADAGRNLLEGVGFFGLPRVERHREYCHYELCKEEAHWNTQNYNVRMGGVRSWDEALAGGWLNPLNRTARPRGPPASLSHKPDPFFLGPAQHFRDQMNAWMDDVTSTIQGYSGPPLTIWEFVDQLPILTQTCSPVPDEYKWQLFFALYQNLKQRIREKVLEARGCRYYDDAQAHMHRPPLGTEDPAEALAQIDEIGATYCSATFCPARVDVWVKQLAQSCARDEGALRALVGTLFEQYCAENCGVENPFVTLTTDAVAAGNPLLQQIQARLGDSCTLKTIPDPVIRQSICRGECCMNTTLSKCTGDLVSTMDGYLASGNPSGLALKPTSHAAIGDQTCLPWVRSLERKDSSIEISGEKSTCRMMFVTASGESVDPARIKRLAAPDYLAEYKGANRPTGGPSFAGFSVRARVNDRWITLYAFSDCPLPPPVTGQRVCGDQIPNTCEPLPSSVNRILGAGNRLRDSLRSAPKESPSSKEVKAEGAPPPLPAWLRSRPHSSWPLIRAQLGVSTSKTGRAEDERCYNCVLDALRLLERQGVQADNQTAAVTDSKCFKYLRIDKMKTAVLTQYAPTTKVDCKLVIKDENGNELVLTEGTHYESVFESSLPRSDFAHGAPPYSGLAVRYRKSDGSETKVGYIFSTCDLSTDSQCSQEPPVECFDCLSEALEAVRAAATGRKNRGERPSGCFIGPTLRKDKVAEFQQIAPVESKKCELKILDEKRNAIDLNTVVGFASLAKAAAPVTLAAGEEMSYTGFEVRVRLKDGTEKTGYIFSSCDLRPDPRCREKQPPPCYTCLDQAIRIMTGMGSAANEKITQTPDSTCFDRYVVRDKYYATLDQKWPTPGSKKGCKVLLVTETKQFLTPGSVAQAGASVKIELLPDGMPSSMEGLGFTGFAVPVKEGGAEKLAYVYSNCDLGPDESCEPGHPGGKPDEPCNVRQRPGACAMGLFERVRAMLGKKPSASPVKGCFESIAIGGKIVEAMPEGGKKGDECYVRLYSAAGDPVELNDIAVIIGKPQSSTAPGVRPATLPAGQEFTGTAVFVRLKAGGKVVKAFVFSNCKFAFEDDCTNVPVGVTFPSQPPIPAVDLGCQPGAQQVTELATQLRCDQATTDITQCVLSSHIERCLASANFKEVFTATPYSKEYLYTLWYYDQAGNLAQIIPPAGVEPLADISPLLLGSNPNLRPAHRMPNRFGYNTRNQTIWQQTPDTGYKRLWYNDAGQLRFAQSAQQADTSGGAHSYTVYDAQGRVVEVGVVSGVPENVIKQKLNEVEFPRNSAFVRSEQIETAYDRPSSDCTSLSAQNLRGRVVATKASNGTYGTVTTCFSYDPHGNVMAYTQNIPGLGTKRIDYDYDLISAKVTGIHYQIGQSDQMHHRYEYDADDRIKSVHTSRDGELWDQDARYTYYKHGPLARLELGSQRVQGLDYTYTVAGWLKGINSETLSASRDPGKDGDPTIGNSNSVVAPDVIGVTLGYFPGDFKPIGIATDANRPDASTYSSTTSTYSLLSAETCNSAGASEPNCGLYDGNISSMVIANRGMDSPVFQILGSAFRYDQLGRLRKSRTHYGINVSQNLWPTTGSGTKAYSSEYTYDLNGNFNTLTRYGWRDNVATEDDFLMDSLRYKYQTTSSAPDAPRLNNRLLHINETDPTIDSRFTDDPVKGGVKDLDDQGSTTSGTNYNYDKDGNLTLDQSDGLQRIAWNYYGRITAIYRSATDPVPDIVYLYDGLHNRVGKIIRGAQNGAPTIAYDYVVRDVHGIGVATYSAQSQIGAMPPTPSLNDHTIYAGKRIGVWLAPGAAVVASTYGIANGEKRYELVEHRGSIVATISDLTRVQVGVRSASIDSVFDYYPFGSGRPYRFSNGTRYRFGYSGLEQDAETRGSGNTYLTAERSYDARVGRWTSPDPKWALQGPRGLNLYQYSLNNPVLHVDTAGDIPREIHFEPGPSKQLYTIAYEEGKSPTLDHLIQSAKNKRLKYSIINPTDKLIEGMASMKGVAVNEEAFKVDARGVTERHPSRTLAHELIHRVDQWSALRKLDVDAQRGKIGRTAFIEEHLRFEKEAERGSLRIAAEYEHGKSWTDLMKEPEAKQINARVELRLEGIWTEERKQGWRDYFGKAYDKFPEPGANSKQQR